MLIFDLLLFGAYQSYIIKHGERGTASRASNKLCDWLLGHSSLLPITLDPIIRHQLLFLSKGKISALSFHFIEANVTDENRLKLKDDFVKNCQIYFTNDNYVYIFSNFSDQNKLVRSVFSEIVDSTGKQMIKIQEFSQDDGEIVYEIYKVI
jgi:hypothetical protein